MHNNLALLDRLSPNVLISDQEKRGFSKELAFKRA